MLRMQSEFMKVLSNDELFKYVSNGWFIKDCLLDEESFTEIFHKTVLASVSSLMSSSVLENEATVNHRDFAYPGQL